MTDLKPTYALGFEAAHHIELTGFSIAENANLGLASLSLSRGQQKPKPLGVSLPDVGGVVSNARATAFWIGVDTWMIAADGKAEVDFAAELKTSAPDCVITEQTDGFVCIDVSGSANELDLLLTKLVNINPKLLCAGKAVRTGLEHMTVFVVRPAEGQLSIFGMRSYAGSLWHAIETAIVRQSPIQT